jgi:hypothetical protein
MLDHIQPYTSGLKIYCPPMLLEKAHGPLVREESKQVVLQHDSSFVDRMMRSANASASLNGGAGNSVDHARFSTFGDSIDLVA